MLIASDDPQRPMESLGKTVWSIIPPAPGHPATVAVNADADIRRSALRHELGRDRHVEGLGRRRTVQLPGALHQPVRHGRGMVRR